jgi:hypothetical protein
MTQYTYAQLEQLWINNGGSKMTAPLAAAIAEAESSGRSDATSSNPDGGTNVGLWQLDTPGGVGAGHSVSALQDPNLNAQVAVRGSSNGTNWGDWETYVTGAYKQYMNGSTTPDPNVPSSATLDAANSGSDCLIGPFPHTSFCILSKSQARALIGGMLLIGGGLIAVVGLAVIAVHALNKTGVPQKVIEYTPVPPYLGAVKKQLKTGSKQAGERAAGVPPPEKKKPRARKPAGKPAGSPNSPAAPSSRSSAA